MARVSGGRHPLKKEIRMKRRMVLLLLAWSLPAAALAQEGTGPDWPMYNGTHDSQRYSSLDQINIGNVNEIHAVWAFQTGIANPNISFENTPIVVDGVMYVSTGNNIIYAMDAATGALKWSYDPKVKVYTGAIGKIAPGIDQQLKLCCGQNSRGLAFYKGRIYMGTLDGRLIALNAEDGSGVTTFTDSILKTPGQVQVLDLKQGYSWTAAPIVWDDKIFFGAAGSEYRTRGEFSAHDANTGKLLWNWYTIPAPNEPGGDTWPNKKVKDKFPYEIGGVGVWMNPTIDVANRQVIFGTGNPNPDWHGENRAGDNLYSCAVVSLDADKGTLNWHFQEVRHDLWDYDQAAAPILFTSTISGQPVEAVGAAGKTGWFYIIDRKTGKPLIEMKEIDVPQAPGQATANKQLVPATVEPFVPHKNMWAPPTLDGVLASPGLSGGSEWSPISFNPKLNYAFVSAIEKEVVFCRVPTLAEWGHKPPTEAGQECNRVAKLSAVASKISPFDTGGAAIIPPPPAVQPHGAFIAIDVNTYAASAGFIQRHPLFLIWMGRGRDYYLWGSDGYLIICAILAEMLLLYFGWKLAQALSFSILWLFIAFAGLIRRMFRIEKRSLIPLGGFALTALGECLEFGVRTIRLFAETSH